MKKLFTKLCLLTIAMVMGVSTAWAGDDVEWTSVYLQDYQDAVATDWKNNNASSLSMKTSGTNKYAQQDVSGSGNRGAYWDIPASTKTAIQNEAAIKIEFDAMLQQGNTKDRSQSAFIIGTNTSAYPANSIAYTKPLFAMGSDQNTSGSFSEKWYITGLNVNTATTVPEDITLASFNLTRTAWYHFVITLEPTETEGTNKVTAIVSNTGGEIANVSYNTTFKVSDIRGIASTVGRNYGYMAIDNIGISKVKVAGTCDNPTKSIIGANGSSRKIELSCTTEGASIYYSESELTEAEGGTEYTEPFFTTATTIYAYAKTEDAVSEVVALETGAGTVVSLNKATFSKAYYDESSSSFFVTTNDDQSAVLGAPTATLAYYTTDPEATTSCTAGTPISGFAPGSTVNVVASAPGYASSTASYTFPVLGAEGMAPVWTDDFTSGAELTTNGYFSISSINYDIVTKIGDEDLSGNVGLYAYTSSRWSSTTDGLKDNGSYYLGVQNVNTLGYIKFVVTAASFENTLITGRSSVASTYNVKNADGTYSIFVKSTGTASSFNGFNALTIKSVSFVVPVLNSTLNAEGLATFSAACPMQITGAKAYKAAVDGDKLVLTEIADAKVPAGVGVILAGEADATATATAIAEAPAIEGNALLPTTLADGTLAAKVASLALSGKSFVTFDGDAFTANKAYLPASAVSPAKGLTIVFDDEEATAINGVAEAAPVAVKKFFKNGQLLIQTAKGTVNAVGVQVK